MGVRLARRGGGAVMCGLVSTSNTSDSHAPARHASQGFPAAAPAAQEHPPKKTTREVCYDSADVGEGASDQARA